MDCPDRNTSVTADEGRCAVPSSMRAGHRTVDPRTWVDTHGDCVWRFVLARTGDASAAEDIVQETFLAALQGAHRFDGRAAEQTWLLGVAAHKVADHYRRLARERRRNGSAEVDRAREPGLRTGLFKSTGRWARPPAAWPESEVDPAETADSLAALRRCIDALPPGQREVIWMRELVGMSSGEVCAVAGLTESNLWTRLHRARQALRYCMERAFGKRSETEA